MSEEIPIVIFGYKRPDHLRNCLQSLEANLLNRSFPILIFVDGPKSSDELPLCIASREVAISFSSRFSAELHFSDDNLGLANSIRRGVSYSLERYNSAIFLEDDLVVSPVFYDFMFEALTKYESYESVIGVQGFQYPGIDNLNGPVFMRGADCWAWGTWRNRWELINFSAEELYSTIKGLGLQNEFDLNGKMNFLELLKMRKEELIDSWAICWHASAFLQSKLFLFPQSTLALNLGQDGSGTNSGVSNSLRNTLTFEKNWKLPDIAQRNIEFENQLGDFYANSRANSIPQIYKLKVVAKRFIGRFL